MIVNRQRHVRVPVKGLADFLARARRTLQLPAGSLTVCLVTNAQIARWNRAYRGERGSTDVLSFPAQPEKSTRGRAAQRISYLGDIAIAPAVARQNARRFGRTFSQEMRILILHGILHLMGYDHETDTGQMDRRERRLRRELGLG
jgi:probable rRNA maturation factor